ncbi:MAG: glycerophosphodiester phosphodiesterase [Cytophagaceae bacterium]|nr:glycerophosphodiester phosphodiesterase [Cytophagaceae bacterium]|tara:strand:- start:14453 stop:15379 length:927 start_codon:yes stop_codon:yes gene_type:complete
MKTKSIFLLAMLALALACKENKPAEKEEPMTQDKPTLAVQGHRGERGNLPENTIEAFLGALHKGVDVLELDVVISKDNKVVVSHEPFMNSLYMSTPGGEAVAKEDEDRYNLHEMDYEEIRQWDSGSRGNKNFPQQQRMKTYKPLLSEMIDTIQAEIAAKGLPQVKYNIEVKSVPEEYDVTQPQPEPFVDLLMEVINSKDIEGHYNIQSFDPAPLEVLHTKYPEVEIAYLVGDGTVDENMQKLSYTPQIYSPHYKLVTDSTMVNHVHELGMKLIPWTVNDSLAIAKMIELKVDGIITDYPERVIEALEE